MIPHVWVYDDSLLYIGVLLVDIMPEMKEILDCHKVFLEMTTAWE